MAEDLLHNTLLRYLIERPESSAALGVGLAAFFIYLYRKAVKSRNELPLPPGPKPLPVLGNMLQIPTQRAWKAYAEWQKEYGDVIYLSALGQSILVVNSLEAAQELLAKRGPNYSDRPYTPVLGLINMEWTFALANYGTHWREQRAIFHRALNYTQIHRYHPVIEQETRAFLPRLLADPKDHRNLIRYLLSAVIMRVSYGSADYEHNKCLAHSAEAIIHGFFKYSNPSRLIVNTIHSLRFVPSWMPGAGWKRRLEEIAPHSDESRIKPFEEVQRRMKEGTQTDYTALAAQFIEALPQTSDPDYAHQKENAMGVAAAAFVGGADTSVGAAIAMVLALAMNPHVQRIAQDELDTIVGSTRLPSMSDLPHLPYIQAIVKEVTRWHTVLPLGIPHVSREEDTYNGYRIPAGTVVIPNSWAIMHDTKRFPDPYTFKPERYLGKDGKINTSILDGDAAPFGYGRRICPGRHFSNDNLLILAATLLACFNIEPAADERGVPIPLRLEEELDNLISAPLPYECTFVPRSPQHVALISSYRE